MIPFISLSSSERKSIALFLIFAVIFAKHAKYGKQAQAINAASKMNITDARMLAQTHAIETHFNWMLPVRCLFDPVTET